MIASRKIKKENIFIIISVFIFGFVFQSCQNPKEENISNSLGVGRSVPAEVYKRLIKQVEDTVAIDLAEIRSSKFIALLFHTSTSARG